MVCFNVESTFNRPTFVIFRSTIRQYKQYCDNIKRNHRIYNMFNYLHIQLKRFTKTPTHISSNQSTVVCMF